ncbi:unnamed protein product [Prorocentrum cordatum]|uniref:Uncharacterized protein n=1 Tax=Prorocentrum cordatum TaxID=2364126 RepID=A0ABN9SYT7_9DINO|nr:unnamed protein product [Polarella glacialis]
MGNVSFANEAEPLNIASGGIDCGSATNTARSSPPSTSWISPCIQSGLSLYRGKMKEKQKQVIRDDVFDMFLNVLELLLGYLVLFAQTLPEDAELPPIRRKRNTQTQLILDFPENMGKYGKWAGRQKPRKYGKIWGIILFVCIYLCVSGPLQSRSCGWTVARGTARAGQGGRARDRAASHGEVAERRRRRRRASTSTSPRRRTCRLNARRRRRRRRGHPERQRRRPGPRRGCCWECCGCTARPCRRCSRLRAATTRAVPGTASRRSRGMVPGRASFCSCGAWCAAALWCQSTGTATR